VVYITVTVSITIMVSVSVIVVVKFIIYANSKVALVCKVAKLSVFRKRFMVTKLSVFGNNVFIVTFSS
jgi:hypothetical protein